jgi:UDP-glucose 4-epimerase
MHINRLLCDPPAGAAPRSGRPRPALVPLSRTRVVTYNRVLITGGAGFIGSHLAEALLFRGCRITIIDDLSTGRWANIAHLANNPHLRVVIASATEKDLMEREVAEHDIVFHLASAVGVKLVVDEPVKTVETIFHATDVVLRAASRYRRPVLITSTSEVYGKSTQIPFNEDDDVVMGATVKRRWAYACAKALDEFLALAHFHQTALPVYIVRLFNTVGPRQTGQYGMVVPSFVHSALRNEPITIYGDGEQRRCFCSVHDVVRALVDLPTVPAAAGKVVNVGTQQEISIRGLAERVRELCNSKSEIRHISYDEAYGPGFDDMQRRVPDLRRVRELIGWTPRIQLDEIITQVAQSLEDQGESPRSVPTPVVPQSYSRP